MIKWRSGQRNGLLNSDKCHVFTTGNPSKIKYVHAYAIGDSVLELVSSEKDLGVVFDNTLSFEEHIVNKVKKANSMVGMIRRSFLHLSPEMFSTLYITFVRPHREYAHAVWSPKLCKHINWIGSVQRRATRMVSELR